MEHGAALLVAVLYVVLAVMEGGQSAQFRAGAGIVLWWAVIIALALGLWPRTPVPRPALLAGMCLAGLAALTALSLAWSSDDGRAFAEIVRVLSYLGLFVAVVLASAPGRARPWLVGIALGLVVVAALALGTRLEPGIFPSDPLATAIPNARARLNYPLGYWNGVGACMALGLTLLVWISSTAATRAARALAAAALPLLGLALFFTSSRGAVVALAVGLIALLAMGPRRVGAVATLAIGAVGAAILALKAGASPDLLHAALDTPAARRQGHELTAITLLVSVAAGAVRYGVDALLPVRVTPRRVIRRIAIGAAMLIVGAALVLANPLERLSDFTAEPTERPGLVTVTDHLASSEGGGRYQFWASAVDGFGSAPVTGLGAGQYQAWWAEHGTLALFVRNAHSLFVETLAELGVVGLLLLLGFVGVTLVAALRGHRTGIDRPARAGAVAVFLAGLTAASIDWMWEIPAAFAPVVVAAALLTGSALGPRVSRSSGRFGIGIATLLIGWVAILASASTFLMEVKLQDSRDAFDRGNVGGAIDDARVASALQPWAAAPRLQEARLLEIQGDLVGAERAATAAIARSPDDWVVWDATARIRLARDNLPGFYEAMGRALSLRPDVRAAGVEEARE